MMHCGPGVAFAPTFDEMAPVILRYVVRFSSEDAKNRAANLLKSSPSSGSWTGAKDEISGRIEAEFQFEKACCISHIDIGNNGSAFVEILVGSSMWAHDREYQTLLPSTAFMKPDESKTWTRTHIVRMFNEDSFTNEALGRQWDRVRIICRQPFRKDKQFGLSFIRIASKDDGTSPTVGRNTLDNTDDNESSKDGVLRLMKKASGLAHGPRMPKTSPKELLNRGAKMLQAALDSRSPKTAATPKLQSVTKERRKRSPTSPETAKWGLSGKNNLCDEIDCFLKGINFSKLDLENVTFADLRRKMERQRQCQLTKEEKKLFFQLVKKHIEEMEEEDNTKGFPSARDNDIPSHVACTNTSRKRHTEVAPATVCTTRSPTSISDTGSSPKPTITHVHNNPPKFSCVEDSSKKSGMNLEDDSFDLPSMLHCSPLKKPKVDIDEDKALVECPLCMLLFPCNDIENHAALCMSDTAATSSTDSASRLPQAISCPICLKEFPLEEIDAHADACAENMCKVDTNAVQQPVQENNVILIS